MIDYIKAERLKYSGKKYFLFALSFMIPAFLFAGYVILKRGEMRPDININIMFMDTILTIYSWLLPLYIFLIVFDGFYIESKSNTWQTFFYTRSSKETAMCFLAKMLVLYAFVVVLLILHYLFINAILLYLNFYFHHSPVYDNTSIIHIIKLYFFIMATSLPVFVFSFFLFMVSKQIILYFSVNFLFLILSVVSSNNLTYVKYAFYSHLFFAKYYFFKNKSIELVYSSLSISLCLVCLIFLLIRWGHVKKIYLHES
jgi:hypothetical protein